MSLEESQEATVLLIDDDPDQVLVCEHLLEKNNYKVLSTTSAREGLKLLGENQIDIIVCDVMMPDICGHEVLARVKGDLRYQQVPVIMLTAADYLEDFSLNSGADDFCQKSHGMRSLLKGIKRVLNEKERVRTTS